MNHVENMTRAQLLAEAASYGYEADRDDTDNDLRSVVRAGRGELGEPQRWGWAKRQAA